MGVIIVRWGLVGIMALSSLALGSQVKAEEWKMQQGGIEPGKVVLGMRAGFAPLTQSLTANTSTDVAPWSISKRCIVSTSGSWQG